MEAWLTRNNLEDRRRDGRAKVMVQGRVFSRFRLGGLALPRV